MKSCLYEGYIRHRRFTPVRNTFRYRIFFLYLDLGELRHVFDAHPLWSVERVNLAYFRRRDHFGAPGAPLEQAVRNLVQEKAGFRPEGPVRLLTQGRYWGYCFNPVSFYYCYDGGGDRLQAVVAEIHNTPWREEHCYVLTEAMNVHPYPDWKQYRFDKAFHVSPFMEMAIEYDWRFRVPGQALRVHMNLTRNSIKRFDATLALKRVPITSASLTRVLLLYPLMTCKITAMIYLQAVRLRLKGAHVYTHPRKAAPGASANGR